jgi:hypothetical protein
MGNCYGNGLTGGEVLLAIVPLSCRANASTSRVPSLGGCTVNQHVARSTADKDARDGPRPPPRDRGG